jgi:hypothetical protein
MVHGVPRMVAKPDVHEYLVQMPLSLRASVPRFGPTFPNLAGEVSSEAIHTKPNTLVSNIKASLVEQVLQIPAR